MRVAFMCVMTQTTDFVY